MILKVDVALKCRALWRRKMAGARRGAQPILDAGALTQAWRGDRAGRIASAGETYITTQDLLRGWVRQHRQTCSFQKNLRPVWFLCSLETYLRHPTTAPTISDYSTNSGCTQPAVSSASITSDSKSTVAPTLRRAHADHLTRRSKEWNVLGVCSWRKLPYTSVASRTVIKQWCSCDNFTYYV